MKQDEAQALAVRLMIRHGLIKAGWKFAFNDRKRALGLCDNTRKTIFLSTYFLTKVSAEKTQDAILHEIAHALDFVRHGTSDGHGPKWKSICREIGANPERLFKGTVKHQWKYVLKYEDRIIRGYHRLPPDIHLRLKGMGLRGRPETVGKLKLFKLAY